MRSVNKTTIDGRYGIERPLGSGGMAEVFLAHDSVLDRDVALKVLRTQYRGDEEFYERFGREARNAASLSHPNIVPIFDRGETPDGTCYIAMEYVSGGTLKEWLDERGPMEPQRALAVTAQVAEALWAAHDRGMVHRDIKPQNILVTDMGHLKVTDFGIARAASAATISATNAVFGTAGYLSPEQALGEPATPRSDLYSLGIVLYEMLTGIVPYRADNPVAVCMKHVTEPLTPPRRLDPTIPEAVDALVIKMLAKDPADRPANASELLDDIEVVRKGTPPPAPTPRTGTPRIGVRKASTPAAADTTTAANEAAAGDGRRGRFAGRRVRRRWAAVMVLCALFALGLLGAATLGLSRGPQEGTPLGRVQGVAGQGLDAPTAGLGGPGDADGGTTGPPPEQPPSASPPASVPPDGSAPADDQYDGG
ncbi:MAG: Serine/threonine protein kinase [uncultured Rubrobacteraceae bacterium]|uniref:non-specific serine/threonine protein kinase n=1 Tax=uncultured Rubrobacteraceae bacterium TaxID=349277 RepID=A0A6J4PB46_9ACTN|nr:MAG: Serine/threonine protein kinase [uncultured Rubrobacteraceae bacterium]